MANVLVQESSLSAIADAIREKNGTQNTYKPAQMASAIEAISGGGITPTGTINITTNGTHDVTQYASANVNVPTGGSTPTGTKQISITENGTTTEDVTNYASAEITVNVPSSGGGGSNELKALLENTLTSIESNATSIKTGSFQGSSNLETASFPLATEIGSGAFADTSKLTSLSIPSVTTIVANAFNRTKLGTFIAPSCTTVGNTCFNGSTSLTGAEFGTSVAFGNSVFYSCTNLNLVVFRGSSVTTFTNGTSFNGTKFAAGKAGGTIYVPNSLKSAYETALATLLSDNSNNQILAIEGSTYETHHIDGTTV